MLNFMKVGLLYCLKVVGWDGVDPWPTLMSISSNKQ